jgi:hypothetical protein
VQPHRGHHVRTLAGHIRGIYVTVAVRQRRMAVWSVRRDGPLCIDKRVIFAKQGRIG